MIMKLLIFTQKVDLNDDVLGFMHGWITEFAKNCEKVTVIALGVGEINLPNNVKVVSLGKETGKSRIKYLINFYKYVWRERKNYDAVFVHMNKEYVILGGLIWRLLGKKIGLWYVHKQVSYQLKLAEKIADVIFTASPESFQLPSSKLKIIGHGIDLNKFYYSPGVKPDGNFKIIYVGRISKIKNQKLLIEAINILVHPVKSGEAGARPVKYAMHPEGISRDKQFNGVNKKSINNIKVDFIGSPIYQDDNDYKNELIEQVKNSRLENYIQFIGSVPNKDMANVYRQADLSINLCPTGGMDKAVLESMATGLPVIVFNKTFAPLFNEFSNLILLDLSAQELADKIQALLNKPKEELNLIGLNLRKKIIDKYNLTGLAGKIVSGLENKYDR